MDLKSFAKKYDKEIKVGLVVFISSGDYAIFAIGMIAYFLVAISGNLCTYYNRRGS